MYAPFVTTPVEIIFKEITTEPPDTYITPVQAYPKHPFLGPRLEKMLLGTTVHTSIDTSLS